MLRRLETFARVDGRRLMDIYREDNIENTDYFYPDMKDKAQALARVEQDFLHYLEALSTHPDFRRRRCAVRLLEAVLAELRAQGPFRLRDCVGKKNVPSLGVHEKCGFRIASQDGTVCLSGEVNERCYGMEYVWKGE